jgi:hypothetical protein
MTSPPTRPPSHPSATHRELRMLEHKYKLYSHLDACSEVHVALRNNPIQKCNVLQLCCSKVALALSKSRFLEMTNQECNSGAQRCVRSGIVRSSGNPKRGILNGGILTGTTLIYLADSGHQQMHGGENRRFATIEWWDFRRHALRRPHGRREEAGCGGASRVSFAAAGLY